LTIDFTSAKGDIITVEVPEIVTTDEEDVDDQFPVNAGGLGGDDAHSDESTELMGNAQTSSVYKPKASQQSVKGLMKN
jgi:hypothetical protein